MLTISARKHFAGAVIDRAVRDALDTVAGNHFATRAAFDRLLRQVRRFELLRPARVGGRIECECYGELVDALLSLAMYHEEWIRPVEAWHPEENNPRPQFASLARHLLAAFPVPAFMTSVWLKRQGAIGRRQQGWFIHIGSGKSIRKLELPLPYTKKMAHHFLQAPDHFTVEMALRWGQVRGLGGSKELAYSVAASRLATPVECEEFWLTVIQFLVNHPDMELAQVAPIVEYLHDQRFVLEEHFDLARDEVTWSVPQPNLSMKGRTPRSLMRDVRKWQASIGARGKNGGLRWAPRGLGPFRHIEPGVAGKGVRVWTIRELLTSAELRAEGSAMHHCVGVYEPLCFEGVASIWSMTVEDQDGQRRVLTIDVNPTKGAVVQARRCCNQEAKPKDREIMGLWAKERGLTVEC
jgi:PcfJ-like protein